MHITLQQSKHQHLLDRIIDRLFLSNTHTCIQTHCMPHQHQLDRVNRQIIPYLVTTHACTPVHRHTVNNHVTPYVACSHHTKFTCPQAVNTHTSTRGVRSRQTCRETRRTSYNKPPSEVKALQGQTSETWSNSVTRFSTQKLLWADIITSIFS